MEAPIADIQEVVNKPPVMDTVLLWIGFDQEATRDRLREEGFESFGDLATMKEKDIRDLAESYGRRTVADGRSIFEVVLHLRGREGGNFGAGEGPNASEEGGASPTPRRSRCITHASADVLQLPDHQVNRKVSAANSKSRGVGVKHIRGGGGGRPASNPGSKRKGIHMPDGSIWTRYYSDWDKMSDADKQVVMDTRKKNKAKGTTPNKKKGSDLKSQIADLKRSIADMQSKMSDDNREKSDGSDVPDNAGDAFGGRQKKRQKKE